MKLVALTLLLALCVVAQAADHPFTNCGSSTDPFHVSSVVVNPDPPVKGKTVDVTVTGTLDAEVKGGQVLTQVYFLGIKVIQQSDNVCDLCGGCPRSSGAIKCVKSLAVPAATPSGNIDVYVKTSNEAKTQISCIELKFTIA